MKAIVNGKRYDTDTARKITGASYGYGGDFCAWEEALYITTRGAFFTAGTGGAMTSYARRVDSNSTSGGSEIRPLSRAEAAQWIEDHGTPDVYAVEFPDLLQDA